MNLVEFIPWFAMAASLALIVILPLLSDGPPQPPRSEKNDRQQTWLNVLTN